MPAPSAGVRQRTSGALPPVLFVLHRRTTNALWASSERPVASNMPGLRAVRHEGLAARHPSVAPKHVPSSQCQKINAHRSQGPAARPFRDEPKCSPEGLPYRLPHLKAMVEPDGIEPTTSCLQSTRSPS